MVMIRKYAPNQKVQRPLPLANKRYAKLLSSVPCPLHPKGANKILLTKGAGARHPCTQKVRTPRGRAKHFLHTKSPTNPQNRTICENWTRPKYGRPENGLVRNTDLQKSD